ncbi:zinc finger CCHC domain-containing protein 9-like [Daktulosphaira vitifoliae]|uniref:zinc finger CCHC domain-containing protein 9-like n=1 Tax=Daktulosphaira vitifoliae TaxID=58002 RepID=UPI0021AA382A|nr:zinc finger CCHC domain-containing protein 9-like [Daktulosphaira vitifoliae]XP_050541034.1 zinc finger CCHC domain-containing protein 9-like [Daktulosphaira vitifoliae]XP_050541035.1 zinc finger CCHC domain-containing protein 9-like [Daktulosphaira vitifoliae]XP_050541036.1 zinc finger CCHC domain-containing protein 9-like [Daktulosphaira vitifoliae]
MTRFARARGSKSSNQKLPEEATPWSQMKQKNKLNSSIEDDSKIHLLKEDKKQKSFSNVEKFDGFSVLKEDAAELRLQKSKLIKQGIPRNQLKTHLLPFRRRAEKRLARLRQKMCFHCRQQGHMLNQCPKLGSNTALGVCFKCGSTEHKLQECRNTSSNQLEYAKCFICNEEGHLSRQCPDNPMGLYPNGGACRLCEDVTHFAKDCPEKQNCKKEEYLPVVGLIDNKAIEELDCNQQKSRKDLSGFNGNKGLKKKKLVIMK